MKHDEPSRSGPTYWIVLAIAKAFLFVWCRLRVTGRRNVPRSGGFLILANHTSFIDPPVVAAAVPRRICFMARASLFRNRLFGRLILSLGAFPVERGASDRAALRRAIEILRSGLPLVLFPEGTRGDGTTVRPFKRGFLLLIRQAGVPVLPVAITGAARVLPRDGKWPRPRPVRARIGTPVSPEEVERIGDEGLRRRLAELLDQLRGPRSAPGSE